MVVASTSTITTRLALIRISDDQRQLAVRFLWLAAGCFSSVTPWRKRRIAANRCLAKG